MEKDVKNLTSLSDLNNEIEICREFTKHFNNDNARKCLVVISQDKQFSEVWCDNLSKINVSLQIKLSKLDS